MHPEGESECGGRLGHAYREERRMDTGRGAIGLSYAFFALMVVASVGVPNEGAAGCGSSHGNGGTTHPVRYRRWRVGTIDRPALNGKRPNALRRGGRQSYDRFHTVQPCAIR